MDDQPRPGEHHARDYRLRRTALRRSVAETEGYAVYDALVDQIDWSASNPWLDLLERLNASQRVIVSLAQVHEHAAFNGLEEALAFHGPDVVRIAAESAAALGHPEIAQLLDAALHGTRDWESLEADWDATASFAIEPFIEAHAADFFVDE